MALICPNCGNEIPIPKRMVKSVKCPFCKDQFGVEYTDEEGNPPKYFWDKHPTATKVLSVTIPIISKAALWTIEHWDEFFPREITEGSSNSYNISDTQPDISTAPEEPVQASELIPVDSEEAKIRLGTRRMHPRRLREGQKASAEKLAEAKKLGMDLQGTHTLVDECPVHYKIKE